MVNELHIVELDGEHAVLIFMRTRKVMYLRMEGPFWKPDCNPDIMVNIDWADAPPAEE